MSYETTYHAGVDSDQPLRPLQVMQSLGLDWEVRKAPIRYELGQMVVDGGKFRALYREDTGELLDILKSPGWNPVQNVEMFSALDNFHQETGASITFAGSSHGGRMVFAQMEMPGTYEMIPGDEAKMNLTFINPHKYGQRITVMFTPIRMVCTNMISMLMRNGGFLNMDLTHRTEFERQDFADLLAAAEGLMEGHSKAAGNLATVDYTRDDVRLYMEDIYLPNGREKASGRSLSRMDQAVELVETQPGYDKAPGTWWNLYNAVTYEVDHRQDMRADRHDYYQRFGAGMEMKLRALEVAERQVLAKAA